MNEKTATFREIGVVEGFYGPLWSAAERGAFIEALHPLGLNTYLYCPKHEAALAADTMGALDSAAAGRLGGLATQCRAHGIALWAGLHLEPPLDGNNPDHLQAAARKCLALAELGCSGFALLFDDVPAMTCPPLPGGETVAARHARTVSEIRRRAAGLGVKGTWAVVPALYTPDPLLEKEYGPFEPGYLAQLDAGLPVEVAWMYTGPRVCSPAVTAADPPAWCGASPREVLLWDNYPVNDAAMVNSLHLAPLSGRASDLPRALRGYLFNPLLQPALGVLPGATCLSYANDPAGYDPQAAWQRALEALLPPRVREPFRELEALTRRSCLETFPPDSTFGKEGPLAGRLERVWTEPGAGAEDGAAALAELRELTATLSAGLPAAMAAEARPWLERLEQAAAVFAARLSGADPGPALRAWLEGKAHVLGAWFDPQESGGQP